MNNKIDKLLQEQIAKLLRTRTKQLEKFASAFILEAGSMKASEYQLIEERSFDDMNMKTTWKFEKK
jgi:hypothetical protein